MPNEIEISFIIVNYRSERYLKKCVASLFNKTKNISFEIIIVNNDKNNLKPFSAEIKRETEENAESLKIINAGKNLGFGRANNIGAKKAKGNFLCFLNPDALLISENIGEIIKEFKKNSEIGAIGPRLISEFNKTQWWCAGVEITLWDLIKNNLGIIKSRKIWESQVKKEADWVSGAALFVPRPLFLKLGGFDESFFMYFEDIDLCKRIKKLGKRVIYFPGVKVRHWGGKSRLNKSEQKKEYYKSQDYYFRKHCGKLISWLARILRKFAVRA